MTSKGYHFCPFCLVKQTDLRKGIPHSPVIFEKYKNLAPTETIFEQRTYESIIHDVELYKRNGSSKDKVKVR